MIKDAKHDYIVSPNGNFGVVKVDLTELIKHHHLVVRDSDGKILMNEPSDKSLIELLTKRFFRTKDYSTKSKQQFRTLVKLARLPANTRSTKYELVKALVDDAPATVKIFKNSGDILDRLELIIGSINSGNTSIAMKNEGVELIDMLLGTKDLSQSEHKTLYDKYFLH
jgi:hypothetical protein